MINVKDELRVYLRLFDTI